MTNIDKHTTLTAAEEDYLLAIGRLPSPVRTVDIATLLSVAAPSVSSMIAKLERKTLLERVSHGKVELTEDGMTRCRDLQRRHRLLELFLAEVLDYSWDEVHDEAHLLEHSVSDRFIDSIDRMLGQPLRDPHGQPIRGGNDVANIRTLAECRKSDQCKIVEVDDSSSELLRYFARLKLYPGEVLEIVDVLSAVNSIIYRLNGAEFSVSSEAAEHIKVHLVEN